MAECMGLGHGFHALNNTSKSKMGVHHLTCVSYGLLDVKKMSGFSSFPQFMIWDAPCDCAYYVVCMCT